MQRTHHVSTFFLPPQLERLVLGPAAFSTRRDKDAHSSYRNALPRLGSFFVGFLTPSHHRVKHANFRESNNSEWAAASPIFTSSVMPPKADSKGTSDLPQKRRRVTRPRTASFAESESPDSQVSDAGKRPLSKRQKLRAGPLANEGAAQTPGRQTHPTNLAANSRSTVYPGTLTAIETICAEYPGLSPALVLSNPRVRAALQPFLDLPVIRPLAKNTRRRKPAALDLLSLGEADRTRAFTALCLQVTGVERDAPCERCSRGFGLWDRCVLSPPVISPDPLNGKCANNSM